MKAGLDPSLVLDSSVTMVWVFEDEDDTYALSVLDAMKSHIAVVPSLYFWEVTNVLTVAVRKGRLTEEAARAFMDDLSVMEFEVVTPSFMGDMKEVFDTARVFGLTAYDAQYLLLAQTLNLPLATLDQALLAAMDSLGIHRFDPSKPPE